MPPPTATLSAFERNNFFYGLLMDAERFRKDHTFFNGKRRLLNRLVIDTGVVYGLDVSPIAGPPSKLTIHPGVAIDGAGREIVVSQDWSIDHHQPTDDDGQPVGALLTTGTVEICLSYAEVSADLVPVLVPDCDGGECAASTIRESFHVVVRPAAAVAPAPGCALGFPDPVRLHDALTKKLAKVSGALPASTLVPIARVDLATDDIDIVTGRRLVYGNHQLFELIICLAERLSAAGNRVLRYVSGDGQSGPAATALAAPLVVELVDAAGNPIAGETVEFTVVPGGGSVASAQVATDAGGRASTTWTLGPPAGEQHVTATAMATLFTVTFHATRI